MNASPGDRVKVKTKEIEYVGSLLPSLEKGSLMLKLDNGYNVGLKSGKSVAITKLKGGKISSSAPRLKMERKSNLPIVSIISTGGTITSRVDYKTGGVITLTKPSELLANVPELNKIANIRLISSFNIMSEDIMPADWSELAGVVSSQLNSGSTGAIVTHGTDTLHYTAAALSFMLPNLSKPVAIVGGQRSSDRGSFDGAMNLICASHYAKSNIAEVAVVMHANESDDYCIAIRGTKVRKMHTSRRDAFRPINDLPIAKIWPNGKIEIIDKNHRVRNSGKVRAAPAFEPHIAMLYFYPGASPDLIDYYIDRGYHGIIIMATGLGHVPTQPEDLDRSWIPQLKRAAKHDIFIGITSQCLYGRTSSSVYTNLRILKEAGAVHLSDMLPETAYVKLGWVLANEKNLKKIKSLMLENLAGEISQCMHPSSFLY